MQRVCDLVYGDAGQRLDAYLPDAPRATYVYLHGGGLVSGDKADNPALFEHLAARGIATVSVNYRLLPEADYPAAIEDGAQALRWALSGGAGLLPGTGCVLGGSSAGAYISMMLAFDRRYLAARGLEPEALRGFIFDAGQPTTHYELLSRRGFDPRRIVVDEAAPLYHISDARPGRPLLVLTAEFDMPARVEQNALMRRVLLNYGYPESMIELHTLPGYQHTGYCCDIKPDGRYQYGDLCAEFILRACS